MKPSPNKISLTDVGVRLAAHQASLTRRGCAKRRIVKNMSAANEKRPWGKWKCTALTAGICSVVLSPLLVSRPLLGLCALALVALLFFLLLSIFGDGFVVEGAVFVVIISILMSLLVPALMRARERASNKQQLIQDASTLPAPPGP